MKKLFGIVAAVACACGLLTSCDNDEKESMRLQGEWEGDFYATYSYYYKAEKTPRIAYADVTYMQFVPNHLFGSTRGIGYEVDIYNSGPIAYMKYEFDWRVDEGHIYLDYYDAPEMNVVIDDYRLTYTRFQGRFGENNNTIDLRKYDSFDGSVYTSVWEYRQDEYITGYYKDFHGGRTRAEVDDEAELLTPEDVEIISVGRARKK